MIAHSQADTALREGAEAIAVRALAFLAGEEEALVRFLRLSGINPSTLRHAAADPAFLSAVLDYFLENEKLLLALAAHLAIAPHSVAEARRRL